MPTIKLVKPRSTVSAAGKFSPEAETYNGQRTAPAMVSYALSALNDYIVNVDEKAVDAFLAQKTPKIILFTNKPKASDLYRALASEFRSRAAFGIVQQSDASVVSKFGVKKFPTILSVNDADLAQSVAYEGPLKAVPLGEFIGQHSLPPRTQAKPAQKQAEKPKVEEMKPVVNELKSTDTLKTLCVDKGGLCAIAFIDSYEESKAGYVAQLEKAVQKQYKNFRFFLTDQHQTALRDALGVPEMLPGLAVYNPSKGRSIVFRSAFSDEKIVEFLENILSGSVRKTIPVDKLPEWQQPPKDEL
jgi:protein disulfide-isomerase A6